MSLPLVLAPLILIIPCFSLLVPVLIRLCRPCREDEITQDWLDNFSVSSYYPMENLLGEEDFRFLCRQPGFDLSLYKKLRRDRLHIFQQYLRRAISDFKRLHLAARIILPLSKVDRSDIAARLIWLKVLFSIAVLRAQASYLLCCVGFQALAVRALIEQLDAMSIQVSALAATNSQ